MHLVSVLLPSSDPPHCFSHLPCTKIRDLPPPSEFRGSHRCDLYLSVPTPFFFSKVRLSSFAAFLPTRQTHSFFPPNQLPRTNFPFVPRTVPDGKSATAHIPPPVPFFGLRTAIRAQERSSLEPARFCVSGLDSTGLCLSPVPGIVKMSASASTVFVLLLVIPLEFRFSLAILLLPAESRGPQ